MNSHIIVRLRAICGLTAGRISCSQHGSAVFTVLLLISISMVTLAQDENETCPCFNYEEVESIFLSGEPATEAGGMAACHTEDYSVESNAEVVVWDQDFNVIAHARVDWFDFDPGHCEFIDTAADPDVERRVSWPHPAPKQVARACFDIIASVIAKLDSSYLCETYP